MTSFDPTEIIEACSTGSCSCEPGRIVDMPADDFLPHLYAPLSEQRLLAIRNAGSKEDMTESHHLQYHLIQTMLALSSPDCPPEHEAMFRFAMFQLTNDLRRRDVGSDRSAGEQDVLAFSRQSASIAQLLTGEVAYPGTAPSLPSPRTDVSEAVESADDAGEGRDGDGVDTSGHSGCLGISRWMRKFRGSRTTPPA